MASCNVITDLLLVFFPVPLILKSHMKKKKKIQMVLLFSLSLGVVGVTLYRVPHVLWAHGSQQTRSLFASIEILSATCAANALVLGSFVRDRGVKKMKFRRTSVAADSIDQAYNRRPTVHRHWGSDEDLVRDLGLGVNRELRDERQGVSGRSSTIPQFSPAPVASVAEDMNNWRFPQQQQSNEERSDAILLAREPLNRVSPRYTPTPTMTAIPTGYRRGSQTLLQDLGSLFGSRQSKANKRAATELQPIPQQPREHRRGEHSGIQNLMDPGGLLK
ncbi:hypothetical protein DL770_002486 [Monosporascus sp. CRB-9-2]|nr:hypothetical protein DL770_002486 [Monosporascus sp. CRB-9-2]